MKKKLRIFISNTYYSAKHEPDVSTSTLTTENLLIKDLVFQKSCCINNEFSQQRFSLSKICSINNEFSQQRFSLSKILKYKQWF